MRTSKKGSTPSVRIADVEVSFATRDVRYASESERWQLERMIHFERSLIGPHRELVSMRVETDYLGVGSRVVCSVRTRGAGDPTLPAGE